MPRKFQSVVSSKSLDEFRLIGAICRSGAQVIPEMKVPKNATIQYVGFPRNRRIMEFAILSFFRKALEISGAKTIDVHFTLPIEAGEGYCELWLSWDGRTRQ